MAATNQDVYRIASSAFTIAQESFYECGERVFHDGYMDKDGNFHEDLYGTVTFNLQDDATAAALVKYEKTAHALVDALVHYGYGIPHLKDIFQDFCSESHYHTVSDIFQAAIDNLNK